MKDVLCPVCNTRGVPFWKVYWMRTKVNCQACDALLTLSIWRETLVFLGLLIPAFIVGIFLMASPPVGWLLVIPYILALKWIQARFTKLTQK